MRVEMFLSFFGSLFISYKRMNEERWFCYGRDLPSGFTTGKT